MVMVNKLVVILILDIIYWWVLINSIVIVVIVNKEMCVVNIIKSNYFCKNIWMLEKKVDCMVGVYWVICCYYIIKLICFMFDKRNSFFNYIVFIGMVYFCLVVIIFLSG